MKKITLIEILLLGLMTISISMSIFGRNVATKSIYFQVNMTEELAKVKDKNTIGIRGNIAPLSCKHPFSFNHLVHISTFKFLF